MKRSASSFARVKGKFQQQPTVLILCEDKKSSKVYLEEAALHFRSHAKVRVHHCGKTDPLGIVQEARKQARHFDEVHCVIDRDTHDETRFSQAMDQGAQNRRVSVLASYPCFEFWLLMHFKYTRSPFNSVGQLSSGDRVVRELMTHEVMKDYDKGLTKGLFERLRGRLDKACQNARSSLRDAALEGEMNPSTPIHQLMDRLKVLGEWPD